MRDLLRGALQLGVKMYNSDDLLRYLGCAYAFDKSIKDRVIAPEIIPPAAAGSQVWIQRGKWALKAPLIEALDGGLRAVMPIFSASPDMAEGLKAALAHQILGFGDDLVFEAPSGRLYLPAKDYAHYLSQAQAAFLHDLSRPKRAEPCAACASCPYALDCVTVWRREDSLYTIANISRGQVKKLEDSGLRSAAALATYEGRVKGLSALVLDRLRAQARLQKSPYPIYELRPVIAGKGFTILPSPQAGDLFLQLLDGEEWDVSGQKLGFGALLSALREALLADPKAHFYHFGSADISHLRQLCAKNGQGEALLDQFLRERRFIDLAAVARGALMTSAPDYGLESIGKFSGGADLPSLRDWLLSLRPDMAWPETPEAKLEDETPSDLQILLQEADLAQDRKQMLYDLGMFHEREAKPAWWAIFDSLSREDEALMEDLEALGGLRALGPVEPFKRSVIRRYRFADQESKLRAGKKASVSTSEGFATVNIEEFDRKTRSITLKVGAKNADLLADRLALHPDKPISSDVIAQAMKDVIADQCGEKIYSAVNDLLDRAAPRLGDGPILQGDLVPAIVAAVGRMDHTTLAIQGPPGTGKTYVSARAILDLVGKGYRVGVASNSHEAVKNLLMGCLSALGEQDLPFEIIHKLSSDDYPEDSPIIRTTDNAKASAGGAIVGGTAFFFARDENIQAFDWLFVDEAGQVGLANMAAMGRAARNIVLVGDPRQLPQVIQGSHPHPANLSCFEWLLGDDKTIPEDRGIFLSQTRRMHPKVNDFISQQIYEGRLLAHETDRQAVIHPDYPQAGAYFKAVAHEGNAQSSIEEVQSISSICDDLLTAEWRDKDGNLRKVTPQDIIVVAPYNAQVNLLAEALPHLRVGTVDKFQGQEAPICLVSMTASSAEETSRGMEFLFSLNRINVAISRAKGLAIVVGAPALRQARCETLEQVRLVNTLCALPEIRKS